MNLNLTDEVVKWPSRLKPIPKPFYVVRVDDHFMVCKLDENMDLVDEVSVIHWNKWVVRRWAFYAAERAGEGE